MKNGATCTKFYKLYQMSNRILLAVYQMGETLPWLQILIKKTQWSIVRIQERLGCRVFPNRSRIIDSVGVGNAIFDIRCHIYFETTNRDKHRIQVTTHLCNIQMLWESFMIGWILETYRSFWKEDGFECFINSVKCKEMFVWINLRMKSIHYNLRK